MHPKHPRDMGLEHAHEAPKKMPKGMPVKGKTPPKGMPPMRGKMPARS